MALSPVSYTHLDVYKRQALTLKMSYGAQGNDNLGTYYASKGLYTIVSNLGENALVSDRMATPNLKWETRCV